MTRDYVNYKRKRQRQDKRKVVWFFVFFFCIFIAGGFYYGAKQGVGSLIGLKESAGRIFSTYFSQLFHHKQKGHSAPKKLPANPEATIKPIHFDFYDELPKAQLDVPQGSKEDGNLPVQGPRSSLAAQKMPPRSLDKKKNEDEIVQELASDLSSMKTAEATSPYILQLGEFRSIEAAKRYRQALASAGLKVDLVKCRVGKEIVYRLQQGPYHTFEQLKIAKKRLKERGIACDIRKLSPYLS